jgi:hypothetical protein
MLGQLDTFIAFVVVILAVSLMITMLNQAVVAMASLRGVSLRWGVETLLEQLAPKLKDSARAISEEVLRHPLISDSTLSKFGPWAKHWQLATAIRVDELKNILHELADATPAEGKAAPAWQAALRTALADDANKAATRLKNVEATVAGLASLSNGRELLPAHLKEELAKATGDLERWFDRIMDRVTQRFTVSTRVLTLAWALAIAFSLHLDASTLFGQLASNPELRAKLVMSTDVMTQQAERLIDANGPTVLTRALRTLAGTTQGLGASTPPAVASHDEAYQWIDAQPIDAAVKPGLKMDYDRLVARDAAALLSDFGARAAAINSQLATAGLQLMPDYAKHWPANSWPDDVFPFASAAGVPRGWGVNPHFFGVLFSALLLSLGAPFWFNVLKQAVTLRPTVGNLQQQEREKRA